MARLWSSQIASGVDVAVAGSFFLMGLSSWIAVNGIYQELPALAPILPEGYVIFSYVAVAVAAANVWPPLYLLLLRRVKMKDRDALDTISTFLFVGCLGTTACILLAFHWDRTAVVFGHEHSVALIALTFVAGGVDTMTSVIFYPVVEQYGPTYVAALNAGEAATGLVASGLATAQNVDGRSKLNFPPAGYFGGIAGITVISTVAFAFIRFSARGQRTRTRQPIAMYVEASEDHIEHFEDADDTLFQSQISDAPKLGSGRTMLPHVRLALLLGALAFVENGVLTTLTPAALNVYPRKEQLISAAV